MTVDEKCPICGTVNAGLDIEETDGWFECERCGSNVSNYPNGVKPRRLRVFTLNDLSALAKSKDIPIFKKVTL